MVGSLLVKTQIIENAGLLHASLMTIGSWLGSLGIHGVTPLLPFTAQPT
jgi:hypothetical protein